MPCLAASHRGDERRVEIRYHNPYRHWWAGLLFEVVAFLGFMVLVSVIAVAASRLG